MTKDEMNKKLLQQVNSLTSTVDSLNATINAQTQLIAQLNQAIQELKEQLNNCLLYTSDAADEEDSGVICGCPNI